MARRRYRRYYRKNSGKWSTRLTSINVSQQVAGNQSFFIYRTLATNPVQDDNTVSQRFTVKNVNCQVNIGGTIAVSSITNAQQYILYLPQGFNLTEDTPFEHPEWIMAHRLLGGLQRLDNPGFLPAKISTRLARKLDTGDRIVYLLIGGNSNTSAVTVRVDGLVKLNTKAN